MQLTQSEGSRMEIGAKPQVSSFHWNNWASLHLHKKIMRMIPFRRVVCLPYTKGFFVHCNFLLLLLVLNICAPVQQEKHAWKCCEQGLSSVCKGWPRLQTLRSHCHSWHWSSLWRKGRTNLRRLLSPAVCPSPQLMTSASAVQNNPSLMLGSYISLQGCIPAALECQRSLLNQGSDVQHTIAFLKHMQEFHC